MNILPSTAILYRKVLPYCFVSTMIMLLICWYDGVTAFNLSVFDKGHTFLSVMVSYGIVTRSRISLGRYMEARQLLGDTMRISRELIQHTIAFTRNKTNENDSKWRMDVSKRACSLLRAVVVSLENNTTKKDVWQVAELSKEEKQAIISTVRGSNERAPLVLTLFLRTVIASHFHNLSEPLDVSEELLLLSLTSDFLTAYHGLMKLMATPYPFPLVQMTRTLLFVWVFTLPFALASDISGTIPLLFVNFFCTYGFIGLELISIEIENPFGTDPNTFSAKALSEVVISDIEVMLQDIDGPKAVMSLYSRHLKDRIEPAVNHSERCSEGKIRRLACIPSCGSLQSSGHCEINDENFRIDLISPRKIATDYGTLEIAEINILVDRKYDSDDSHKRCEWMRKDEESNHVGDSFTGSGLVSLDSTYLLNASDDDISYDSDTQIDQLSDVRVFGQLPDHGNCTKIKPRVLFNADAAHEKENLNSEIVKSLMERSNSDDSIPIFGRNKKAKFDNETGILRFVRLN